MKGYEMTNGRNPGNAKKGDRSFDGRFAGILTEALYSAAFVALNKVERALLLEFMAQYTGRNNGRLLCNVKKLKSRGFGSADTLHRAKRVLLAAGFIYETVQGHRPNKASWYALTWRPLDSSDRYDHGVIRDFRENGYKRYLLVSTAAVHSAREELLQKKLVIPMDGQTDSEIAPLDGKFMEFLIPQRGTVANIIH
jgi:hypothetical protein